MPACSAPGDEAALDVVPECEARAVAERLELPTDVIATPAVLEQTRCLGPLDDALGDLRRRCSYGGELDGSNRSQVPARVERCPLGEVRRVRQRLPDQRGRVTELSNEDERPLVALLLDSRARGWTWHILLAVGHRFFPFFLGVGSIRSRWLSSASTCAPQKRRNGSSQASTSINGAGWIR
jgi:hypothetical protein